VPFLEKAVEFKPIKAQHLACLIVRECPRPIPFDDKRLKGLASRIRVRRKIIRKMYRNFHNKSLARPEKIRRTPVGTPENTLDGLQSKGIIYQQYRYCGRSRSAPKHQNVAHSGAIIGVEGQSYESIRNAR
jgi:hypothetical protein